MRRINLKPHAWACVWRIFMWLFTWHATWWLSFLPLVVFYNNLTLSCTISLELNLSKIVTKVVFYLFTIVILRLILLYNREVVPSKGIRNNQSTTGYDFIQWSHQCCATWSTKELHWLTQKSSKCEALLKLVFNHLPQIGCMVSCSSSSNHSTHCCVDALF
jgi:predicted permease